MQTQKKYSNCFNYNCHYFLSCSASSELFDVKRKQIVTYRNRYNKRNLHKCLFYCIKGHDHNNKINVHIRKVYIPILVFICRNENWIKGPVPPPIQIALNVKRMVKGYGAIKEKNAKLYHCPANGCDNKDSISKHLKSYNEHKTKRENVPNNKVCPTCSKNFVM